MFPERYPSFKFVKKSGDIVNSMMLLDFDRLYRVMGLKRIRSRHGYAYIITLFTHVESMNYLMISDFWLPKSCLRQIQGSKFVHTNGDLEVWDNQFIRVVGTNDYKGSKYVVIKSFIVYSMTQLKKPTRI